MTDFQITRLVEYHRQQSVECLTKAFKYREPITKAAQVPESEMMKFCALVIDEAINDQFSFVAIDNKSGKLAGVVVNEDYGKALLSHDTPVYPEAMLPIIEILKLTAKPIIDDLLSLRTVFHVIMLGVSDNYLSQNIAHLLVQHSIEHARASGFKQVVTETTNVKTEVVSQRDFGFKLIHTIPYNSYEFMGKKVFSDVKCTRGASLLSKNLV